jgi:hypothetical protein
LFPTVPILDLRAATALVSDDLDERTASERDQGPSFNGKNITEHLCRCRPERGRFEKGSSPISEEGKNHLRVRPAGWERRSGAGSRSTNHSIGLGPVFSGQAGSAVAMPHEPHRQNPTIGPAVDDTLPTSPRRWVEHFYTSNAAGTGWVAYNPSSPPAAELIQQTGRPTRGKNRPVRQSSG